MIHGLLLGQSNSTPLSVVTFTPPGDSYTGSSKLVLITASHAAKVQYKIGDAGWITAPSAIIEITVPLTYAGTTVYANGLDASGSIVSSDSETYYKA